MFHRDLVGVTRRVPLWSASWRLVRYNCCVDISKARREREDVARLTGNDARILLEEAVLALGLGDGVDEWSLHSLHHRPGAGVSAGYSVHVTGGREEYICMSSIAFANVRARVRGYSVWRYPEDPELPLLGVACSPARLSAVLGRRVSVELLTYRPGRRAVVKARSRSGTYFVKVMRPQQTHGMVRRHVMLAEANVPAPAILTYDEHGLIVLDEVHGVPLSRVFSAGINDAGALVRSLARTLDTLPVEALAFPKRAAWEYRADHYAHAAATALPEHSGRCRRIGGAVEDLLARCTDPVMVTHGDLYEANVFVDPESCEVTGLLDIDSLGPGYRASDLGCMVGHMEVLPHLAPWAYPHVNRDVSFIRGSCEELVDPVSLNARAAGVILSLVAGARKVDGDSWKADAEGRLTAAEESVERAYSFL